MKFTFGKHERLTHRKVIAQLFDKGDTVKSFPIRLTWMVTELPEGQPAQVVINVSKRNFKRAVDRNRIKRLLRESWRKKKHEVYEVLDAHQLQAAIGVLYIGKELPDLNTIDLKISQVIQRLITDIANFKGDEKSPMQNDQNETTSTQE